LSRQVQTGLPRQRFRLPPRKGHPLSGFAAYPSRLESNQCRVQAILTCHSVIASLKGFWGFFFYESEINGKILPNLTVGKVTLPGLRERVALPECKAIAISELQQNGADRRELARTAPESLASWQSDSGSVVTLTRNRS